MYGSRLCAFAILVAFAPLSAQKGKQIVVVGPALHAYEGGPPVSASYEFRPGDTVYVSFRLSGYQATERETIRISYKIDAVDASKTPIAAAETGKVEAELAPQDKDWTPKVWHGVLVPVAADSGEYRFNVQVKDEVGAKTATADVPFQVRGRYVEPGENLTLRNFRFLRSEQDVSGLTVGAYKPGDTVWARFDITGYRFGKGNRFEVEYGLSVERSGGKVLYEEPLAAEFVGDSFYPRRHIGGAFSLNLTSDLAPGEYAVLLKVRDRVGDQQYESRMTFLVE